MGTKVKIQITDDWLPTDMDYVYPRFLSTMELKTLVFFVIENIYDDKAFIQEVLEYLGYIPLQDFIKPNDDDKGLFDRCMKDINELKILLFNFKNNVTTHLHTVFGVNDFNLYYVDDSTNGMILGLSYDRDKSKDLFELNSKVDR